MKNLPWKTICSTLLFTYAMAASGQVVSPDQFQRQVTKFESLATEVFPQYQDSLAGPYGGGSNFDVWNENSKEYAEDRVRHPDAIPYYIKTKAKSMLAHLSQDNLRSIAARGNLEYAYRHLNIEPIVELTRVPKRFVGYTEVKTVKGYNWVVPNTLKYPKLSGSEQNRNFHASEKVVARKLTPTEERLYRQYLDGNQSKESWRTTWDALAELVLDGNSAELEKLEEELGKVTPPRADLEARRAAALKAIERAGGRTTRDTAVENTAREALIRNVEAEVPGRAAREAIR